MNRKMIKALKNKYIYVDIDGTIAEYRFNNHVNAKDGTTNGQTMKEIENHIFLYGPNVNSVKKHRGIRQDIRTEISKQRCVVLDVGSSIEVDHKNGKYDELSNIELENQKIDDFQPLSKAANDAKRQHCKDCIKTGKRYDARRLGYKEGWVVGDENTSPCIGCYWYDPKRFNQLISKDYKKEK